MRNKVNTLGVKKIILLTFVFLVVITLSGCGNKKDANQSNTMDGEKITQENSKGDDSKGDGIINSIKEALTSDKTLECTFTSSEDGINAEVKSYVQGEKYKTEFMMDGKKNNSVFDGKVSYSWEEGSKQGIKIDTECLEGFSSDDDSEDFDIEITEESVEEDDSMDVFDGAQNVECHEVGDVDFSVPQDVNFFDQCEMLKKQQDLINDLDGQIPVGMPQF